jgi:hypothetical protein
LHPFYKRRLCTAFALKRVTAAEAYEIGADLQAKLRGSASGRAFLSTPVAMERNFDRLVSLSKTALDGEETAAKSPATGSSGADGSGVRKRTWPSLIVCAAANVSDPGATPPGRSVTSFTFSARSIGGPLIGASPTKQFEKAFDGPRHKRRARDLTLPSAVAISGAAVAPSMGKMTRRPLTFLLALANIRLGVWVPNPRWVRARAEAGERWTNRRLRLYGRPRPSYLIRELLGRNRVDAKYLFVTDGGHYENLGLVELLRRGCTEIYCFDASGDGKFGVLGDAIALARSELGVQVDIDPSKLAPREGAEQPASNAAGANGANGAVAGAAASTAAGAAANGATAGAAASEKGLAEDNVARGTLHYPDGREGVLIYARCVMTKDAPWDVMAHHREDPSFPHNSTIDQLYTDQKFESYRALGALAGRNAMQRMFAAREASIPHEQRPVSGKPPEGEFAAIMEPTLGESPT